MSHRKHANHAHNRPAPVNAHPADPAVGSPKPAGAGGPNQGTSVPKQPGPPRP